MVHMYTYMPYRSILLIVYILRFKMGKFAMMILVVLVIYLTTHPYYVVVVKKELTLHEIRQVKDLMDDSYGACTQRQILL